MQDLDALNPKQREAATHIDGPLLIVAGAGAGKTRTLTHRIAHLIGSGVRPHEILAITFTNKAASEMKDRVNSILPQNRTVPTVPWVGTFHALGVYLLRQNADAAHVSRYFSILDRSDQLSIVKRVIKNLGYDPKKQEPSRILGTISKAKNNMQSVLDMTESNSSNPRITFIGDVWKGYQDALTKENALDFDDLLVKTVVLLRDNDDVRKRYQDLWKYIHIDEYQDTNRVQYELIKLLADTHQNLCVVGDADQNIYSWRGADIRNILNFERDFRGAKTVLLEENYRSTKTILSAANDVIKKNTQRVDKNLYSQRTDGDKIGIYNAFDGADEARFIAGKAGELIEGGVEPGEIAVLYRTNAQSRILEDVFLSSNIPYQVLGVRFFERKEVKDTLAFIRAALNRDSVVDISRVANTPARGIGKVTLEKMLSGKTDTLNGATKSKVDGFYKILDEIRDKAKAAVPSELVKFTIERSGLEKHFKDGTDEDLERLGNIQELASLASRFDKLEATDALDAFLADASLHSEQDSLDRNDNAVRLMTVHAAKGLEFKAVFIAGMEQDLFPSTRSDSPGQEKDRAEEERRLFYVALTRAKDRAYLSHASMRIIYGTTQMRIPSEFLYDINEDHVDYVGQSGGSDNPDGKVVYLEL